MGASSSSDHGPSDSTREEESLAASTGSLPRLRTAFSNLSSRSNSIPLPSLHQTLSLRFKTLSSQCPPIPPHFADLLSNLGPSIASLFFSPSPSPSPSSSSGEDQNDGLNWVDFLRGFNRCCARMPASSSLNLLFKLYSEACRKAEIPSKLEFDSESDDGKVGGSLSPSDLLMLLWMCWAMERSWRVPKEAGPGGRGGGRAGGGGVVVLPDLTHLVLSAFVSCGEVGDDEGVWNCDVFGVDMRVEVQKVRMWVLATAPGLVQCLSQYVQEKLIASAASGDTVESSDLSDGNSSGSSVQDSFLLTCGRAWTISLTLRNTLIEEFTAVSFPEIVPEALDNILYRSSIHGKGLNRYWSNVEGYHGPLLILISASSVVSYENNSDPRRWVIGVLTEQGFENRETFYGETGYLYAICPIFRVLSPSGKDKNFIYSHLHPTAKVYEPNPKPVGLGFGGTMGNERIFIDEDFSKVTVRHHAVDRTYQHSSLIPNQGFLPLEAPLMEVEVWGFGGKAAKAQQDVYKKRESLFSEQRRKVDLKTFGSWEDSPEKMMMDMVSDPNKVRREDR